MITFYNEIYICMNFALFINLNDLKLNDEPNGVIANNIYCLIVAPVMILGPIIIVICLR